MELTKEVKKHIDIMGLENMERKKRLDPDSSLFLGKSGKYFDKLKLASGTLTADKITKAERFVGGGFVIQPGGLSEIEKI